ncbi:MAG: 16S rRNA processing protein RimM [bacterium]|nr:16S rRNA processing protein RimM [bacterium]
MKEELITVGKLGKTRGLHGELYVTPLTDFPDRFLDLTEIFVGNRGVWEKMKIISSRLVGGRPVLGFESFTTPEASARLTNRELAVPRDQVVDLPEDMYYVFEIIGCAVYSDAGGAQLGELVDVEHYPANDAYVVRMTDGSRRMLPATKQAIKTVDLQAKRMVVDADSLLEFE